MTTQFTFRELDLPANLTPTQLDEIEAMRADFAHAAFLRYGAMRWADSGMVIPPSAFLFAYCEPPAGQRAAYRASIERMMDAARMFDMPLQHVYAHVASDAHAQGMIQI